MILATCRQSNIDQAVIYKDTIMQCTKIFSSVEGQGLKLRGWADSAYERDRSMDISNYHVKKRLRPSTGRRYLMAGTAQTESKDKGLKRTRDTMHRQQRTSGWLMAIAKRDDLKRGRVLDSQRFFN